MLASGRALKLGLDDLFDTVGPDFDNSFVVNFTRARNAKHMLARNY